MKKNSRIAIAGSGPVGCYLAIRLVEIGYTNIVCIESGSSDGESPNLNRNTYHFETPSAMPEQVHQFGGGGNLWFGRVGEFSEIDFNERPGLGISKWPFQKSEIEKCYQKVRQILEVEQKSDELFVHDIFERLELKLPREFDIQVFQHINPLILKRKMMDLIHSGKVKLVDFTTILKISRIGDEVFVDTINREKFHKKFEFDYIFLATGTMQTTAIINRSLGQEKSSKLKIGTNLMEHFDMFIGELSVKKTNIQELTKLCLNRRRELSLMAMNLGVGFKPSKEVLMNKQFLNVSLEVVPKTSIYLFAPEKYLNKSKNRNQVIRMMFFFERVFKRTRRFYEESLKRDKLRVFSLWLKAEELPYEKSLLRFHDSPNGSLVYSHQISDKTFLELNRVLDWINRVVVEKNLGSIQWRPTLFNKELLCKSYLNWHPSGTLRMGSNQDETVCDDGLQVHDLKGVFVVSAAVFPTSSNANPTFTSLALAERCLEKFFEKNERRS